MRRYETAGPKEVHLVTNHYRGGTHQRWRHISPGPSREQGRGKATEKDIVQVNFGGRVEIVTAEVAGVGLF